MTAVIPFHRGFGVCDVKIHSPTELAIPRIPTLVRFLTPVPLNGRLGLCRGFHLGLPRSLVHGNVDFPMRQTPMALDLHHVSSAKDGPDPFVGMISRLVMSHASFYGPRCQRISPRRFLFDLRNSISRSRLSADF
jgi:hypothetical protein